MVGHLLRTAVIGVVALAWLPARAEAKGKFFIRITEAEEAQGIESGLLTEAKKLLADELRRRPEFVLDIPGLPTEPDALAAELKRRNLKGYSVVLRLTRFKTQVLPPRQG